MTHADAIKGRSEAEQNQFISLKEDVCKNYCIKRQFPEIECDDCNELYLKLAVHQIKKIEESKNGM
jgi:hypothetical protein